MIFLVMYFEYKQVLCFFFLKISVTYSKKELFLVWRANESDNVFNTEVGHGDPIEDFQYLFDQTVVNEWSFKQS